MFGSLKEGAPLELTATGMNELHVRDILVGEVWMCSGQSNMGLTVEAARDHEREIADSVNYPEMRFFTVPTMPSLRPIEDVAASWTVCSPQTCRGFSATAYFYGRELYRELGVPIGLINLGGWHPGTGLDESRGARY